MPWEFASFDANTPRFQPKYPPVFTIRTALTWQVKQNVLHQQVGETPWLGSLQEVRNSGIHWF